MDNKEKITVIKSASKAAGLKSTLTVGDKLYLTSFGKGNDAILEQQIDTASDYAVSAIAQEPSLHVTEAAPAKMKFDSKRPNVKREQLTADNPLHHGAENTAGTRRDLLGLKEVLEKKYFGRTFDDNIHIQIIYNILDIEKILAVYATNISAAISHLCDGESDATQRDLISYLGAQNTYAVFMEPSRNPSLKDNERNNIDQNRALFEKLLASGRLGYFGFDYKPPKKKDEKDKKKSKGIDVQKKRLYHLLAMAGQFRQWSFHGAKSELWLYQLDALFPKIDDKYIFDKEFLVTLDDYFNERIDEINDNFIDQNKVNLAILEEIYPEEDFAEVAKLYYNFIVVKNYKYMGFSIKKLREVMLTLDGSSVITDRNMDSVRSKLYKLMDFCVYYLYHKDAERAERNNSILRAAVTDDEKEQFYADEADWLWKQFRGRFVGFCDKITGWVQRRNTIDPHRWDDVIRLDEYRETNNISYFAKLLYAMCFFLDGKEINDLLTTLINKFDNIASFIKTARQLNIPVAFTSDYAFFNRDCTEYFREINCVKNISRMKKPTASAKKTMYSDALRVLGIPEEMNEDIFDETLEKMLQKEINPATGNPYKGKNSFRNFIANNVIESNRFIYVIKFCNPDKVPALVRHTEVTCFVLRRMPETQIRRYYESCIENHVENAASETMITALADMMKNMDFSKFTDVRQKPDNPQENMRKERYKAIIRLYLAVVYQLVKNLVHVNARYVMAFHSLERDAALYGISLKQKRKVNGKKVSVDDYPALTRTLLAEGDNSHSGYLARNPRMRGLIAGNLDKADQLVFTPRPLANGKQKNPMSAISVYRNNIAHLTAVRGCTDYIGDIKTVESYYALYHYLIQRLLADYDDTANTAPNSVNPHYANLMKYHTYVKDFVKELNTPFGYNLPRYKNLSIQELFDRNELQPEPKDDKTEE